MADVNSTTSGFDSEKDQYTNKNKNKNNPYSSSSTSYGAASSTSDSDHLSDDLHESQDLFAEGFDKAMTFVQSNWKSILSVSAVVIAGGILVSRRFMNKNKSTTLRTPMKAAGKKIKAKMKSARGRIAAH